MVPEKPASIPMSISVKWLAIADEVRTRIIGLDEYIFMPELSF